MDHLTKELVKIAIAEVSQHGGTVDVGDSVRVRLTNSVVELIVVK